MRMYEDLNNGKSFKYKHCWEIMTKNPKWCSKRFTKTNGLNKQTLDNSIGNSPTTDVPFSNLGDDNTMDYIASQGISSGGVVRPQGRKCCKEKTRRLNDEKGCGGCVKKSSGLTMLTFNDHIV
ncbi:glutathione S-transferase T3-like [Forsythia ovata]|uniref:Glutathione S-transferase T3-like n=1 Tax=Forsythia ovata TaxID=205694 RepID=A0ABD1W7Z3_9LAMI